MLTKDTEFRLAHAVTDADVADEIAARLDVSVAPATEQDAQAILALLDQSRSKSIEERLIIALAGDDRGAAGRELAKKINGMIAVLKAKADGDEVPGAPGEAASFEGQVAGMTTDVTIVADEDGEDGNITLVADGNDDIDTIILAWNTANPENTVSLDSGDGSQVPEEDIELTGGVDEIPASDAKLAPAKAAMGSDYMSEKTLEALTHALTDVSAAENFKDTYNAMIDAIQAIS
jgi:hypothetical protein